MKKILFGLLIALTVNTGFAQTSWEQNKNDLTLNSQLFLQSTAQGAFYGAGGYGLGMWLSGNRTHWGLVGSLLAVNIPLILEDRLNEEEALLGRNLGALAVGVSTTIYVEYNRKGRGRYSFTLPNFLQKH